MFNLIMKDMLLLKKTAIFAFLYEAFLIFAFRQLPQGALYASIVGATYILIVTSMAYEDKNNSDIILNSLPLSRQEIVLAKYMEVFIYGILASAVFVIFAYIFKTLNISIGLVEISFKTIAMGLFTAVLMNSLYFPVFFKLGYIKSKYINFVLFFAFFFLIQVSVESITSGEGIGLIEGLSKVFQGLSQNIMAILILTAAILLAGISYAISVGFYKSREF